MTQARKLDAAYNMCRWLGVFRPAGQSRPAAVAYAAYRAAFFAVVAAVSASMTVRLFASADDLTMLARTIDLWTMCWSALYKWTAMVAFDGPFRRFHALLPAVHDRAAAAAGGGDADGARADRYTAARLRHVGAVSYAYVLSGFLVVVSLSLGPLISYSKGDRSELEYFNDPRSYPLCCWIPFTVSNYSMFVALWALKFTTLLAVVSIYLIVDTYMFGVIYIMGIHLDFLGESLADISLTFDNGLTAENSLQPIDKQQSIKCYSKLSECVKYHSSILQYIKMLRNMFNSLILFDYLHASISLTFLMFQTTNNTGLGEVLSLIPFLVVSIYHQFCNNFFGDYIIQKQLSVRKSAYDFQWLRVDKKSRQLLTMMICRTNKPLIITGFYMYKLCYPSFLAFIQALYTYYMVLRRINN